ncbi:MAG: M48 family metalloprotease [Candidatus Heimdallarchaeota archaeon]|nr:M48 family metalloprotease [Candidatus Heimdallarchaeota archaeon]MBY8993023.1 M48 family metalloprotease [Candidatus Heimdallarchaeota archaeon]
MTVNSVLLRVRMKLLISGILFFLLNFFHIAVASTSEIDFEAEKIFLFIRFFSSFEWWRLLLALGIFIVQITISYIVMFRRFRKAELAQINETGLVGNNNDKLLKNLRIDPQKIYTWVHEQAEEHNIKSIKRVYLTDTSIPNAMTLDVIPLPFIRSSWIVLDANVLEILDEREIRAVISHELGHVKRLDGVVNIFRYGINYYAFLAYLIIILEMIRLIISVDQFAREILVQIGFLLLLIIVIWAFTLLNRFLLSYSRRQSELMADYYAAQRIGRNHIINALVLLGQRLDVISAFGTEFKWLGSRESKKDVSREFLQGLKDLPPEELSMEISREKAVHIYVQQRLKNLKEDLYVPLTDEQIKDLTTKASEKLLALREEQLEKGVMKDRKIASELSKLTIDWFLIDKDKDLYLKDDEVDNLVKEIIGNPNKELFEHDLYPRRALLVRDHPSMKDRIIFLYYAYPKVTTT